MQPQEHGSVRATQFHSPVSRAHYRQTVTKAVHSGMDTATQAPQCRARPPQRPSRARVSSEDLGDGAPAPEAEPVDDPVMPTRFARLKLKRAESPTQRRKSSSMSGAGYTEWTKSTVSKFND